MSSRPALTEWFDQRTFSSDAFTVDQLARLKKQKGLTTSVVLPARNEASTIAGVIASVRPLEGVLVDEIVVLDGASTDGTAEISRQAGVRVYQDSEVLPEFGHSLGKGDALWRSLSVTSGDLVVCIDTDIRNPDPRFVWGVLGPLLTDPSIELVKAYYERPIEVGGSLQPSGGGRVTELMARPLLNLFWPELAGLVQPLSGEFAARRGLLQRIPFFTGYGVELGMLLDTCARSGPGAIAQVDVGRRVHRNQGLPELSRMAFALAQVAIKRLSGARRAMFSEAIASRYVQFVRDDAGNVVLRDHRVEVIERPPLHSL